MPIDLEARQNRTQLRPALPPARIVGMLRAREEAPFRGRIKELEERLAVSYPLYERVVEEASDGLMVVDCHGRIAFCNPAAAAMFNASVGELTGRDFGFPVRTEATATDVEIFAGGRPRFLEMRAGPIAWHGQDASLIALRDVTERREAEAKSAMQAKALEATANGVFITDKAGEIVWANHALVAMTGYDREEMLGKPAALFKSGAHEESYYAELWTRLMAGEVWKGRLTNSRKDGSHYTADQTITPILDATGRLSHFVAIQEDVSERIKAQNEVARLTECDTLTGLPNRHVFMERLDAAIDRARRAQRMVAVIVLDIDNFKVIDNTLGHGVGDSVLVAVAGHIQSLMRSTDTLANLGGDNFGLVLENVKDMAAASRTIRKILESFHRPIKLAGQTLEFTASLGIAAYPKDDTEPSALLRQAEVAMYQAKASGRDAFRYFDREMDADVRRRVRIEADLRRAIEGNQLWLAYQPQLDLATGRIVGAEALIR